MTSLIYAGPSLPLSIRPEALQGELWLAPAEQGDICSDTEIHKPDVILLIDGTFAQNLSVWHKELLFALSRGIRVVGASSMGAIRAADLDRHGMEGVGKIYGYYRDGITEDDSEVALLYNARTYENLTVPLCNIRASFACSQTDLERFRAIHYSERYPEIVAGALPDVEIIDQKRLDALEALAFVRNGSDALLRPMCPTNGTASPRRAPAQAGGPAHDAHYACAQAEPPKMADSAFWRALYAIDRKIAVVNPDNPTEKLYKRVEEVVAQKFAGGGHLARYNDIIHELLALEYCEVLGLPKTQEGLAYLRGALLVSKIPAGINLEILDYLERINQVPAL